MPIVYGATAICANVERPASSLANCNIIRATQASLLTRDTRVRLVDCILSKSVVNRTGTVRTNVVSSAAPLTRVHIACAGHTRLQALFAFRRTEISVFPETF